jgi:hypothetical protein
MRRMREREREERMKKWERARFRRLVCLRSAS